MDSMPHLLRFILKIIFHPANDRQSMGFDHSNIGQPAVSNDNKFQVYKYNKPLHSAPQNSATFTFEIE